MGAKESMTLRVGRIISGSARKIVEILESTAPEIVMEQAIDEIDSSIFELRDELGKQEAEKHIANKRLNDANSKHHELGKQINIAMDENREDLAEAAVQRQLDIESQIPILKRSMEDAHGNIEELNSYIAALQAKKREMGDELKEWRTSKAVADSISAGGTVKSDAEIEAKVARAESAFQRVIKNRASDAGFDAENAKKLAELEELTRKNRIKERLSQIKAQRDEA